MTRDEAEAFAASLKVGDKVRTGSMSTVGEETEHGTLCHVRGRIDGLVVVRWHYGSQRTHWNYKIIKPKDFESGLFWPDDGRTEREHFDRNR